MYELTYILNSNISDSDVASQAERVRGFINDLGAIKNEKIWEKRRLAYPIKKQGFGFYVTTEFETEPEKVVEIESRLRLETAILRHLLITKEEVKAAPRPIFRPRPKEKSAFSEHAPDAEPVKKKVKIEEIDKRLEELLEE